MLVVGSVTTADEAIPAVRRSHPHLVIMDIGLPDRSGLDVGSEIVQGWPDVKVLALTGVDDPRAVREALDLGFQGYLVKDVPVERFVRTVEAVMAGQIVVPGRLLPSAAARTRDEEAVSLLVQQLTQREIEILRLLVEGAEGGTIASALRISPNTVRSHVQSILSKLQVHSRLEAAAFAVRHRIYLGSGSTASRDRALMR